jgi:hypothetical protein
MGNMRALPELRAYAEAAYYAASPSNASPAYYAAYSAASDYVAFAYAAASASSYAAADTATHCKAVTDMRKKNLQLTADICRRYLKL